MGCVKSKNKNHERVATGGRMDPLAAAAGESGKESITEPVNVGTSVISNPDAGKNGGPGAAGAAGGK